MSFVVLGAFAGNRHGTGFKIKLRPTKSTDFLAPTSRQDQQFSDAPEVVIRARPPYRGEFIIGQDAVARINALCGIVGRNRWIALTHPLGHRPGKHC
jgi:hypothetical protein